MWLTWFKSLWYNKPEIKLVPIEKDDYVELLEEEIMKLKEQIKNPPIEHTGLLTQLGGIPIIRSEHSNTFQVRSPYTLALEHSQMLNNYYASTMTYRTAQSMYHSTGGDNNE